MNNQRYKSMGKKSLFIHW